MTIGRALGLYTQLQNARLPTVSDLHNQAELCVVGDLACGSRDTRRLPLCDHHCLRWYEQLYHCTHLRCVCGTSISYTYTVAIVIATLLRHKSTRKFLPQKIRALWEPLRKIRKSRVLKLKACVLIDVCNFAAFFYPVIIKVGCT